MNLQLLLFPLCFYCILSSVESVGIFAADCSFEFCYNTSESSPCGQPNWPSRFCKSGTRQSPINLPNKKLQRSKSIQFNLKKYQSDGFTLTNNGHTVVIKLASSNDNTPALKVTPSSFMASSVSYHLDSAHFHWGTRDNQGSEHCFDGKCLAMEIHLVHYQTKFTDFDQAYKSGEPNALAVIGILFDSSGKGKPIEDKESFRDIYDNLGEVSDLKKSKEIKSQLSFATVLKQFSDEKKKTYTYDGSLTTPCCSEIVNWFVFDTPVKASRENVNKFQELQNSHKETSNYRETQPIGNRVVSEASVSTA